jgi:hypothetical protein
MDDRLQMSRTLTILPRKEWGRMTEQKLLAGSVYR